MEEKDWQRVNGHNIGHNIIYYLCMAGGLGAMYGV